MFKSALMDVGMASSILLNVSVWPTRSGEKCGADESVVTTGPWRQLLPSTYFQNYFTLDME